jgi:hypothetical protein
LIVTAYVALVGFGVGFWLSISPSSFGLPENVSTSAGVGLGAPTHRDDGSARAALSVGREYLATYRVLGPSTRARVTYTDASGDHNELAVDLPWEKSSRVAQWDRIALTVDNLTIGEIVAELHLTEYSDRAWNEVAIGRAATGEPWRRVTGGEFASFTCEGAVGEPPQVLVEPGVASAPGDIGVDGWPVETTTARRALRPKLGVAGESPFKTLEVGDILANLASGDRLVFLLDTECPQCQASVAAVNALVEDKRLPPLVALAAEGHAERRFFARQTGANFPIGQISKDAFASLLLEHFPRMFLVRDGTILAAWDGRVPSSDAILQSRNWGGQPSPRREAGSY